MSSNTPNLGLLKKDPMVDGNETFNIETMLNENWDKVDEAVGQVREDLGNIDVDIPEASLIEKGIVQLSNATNGTRENVAATEKAVKDAYDRGSEGVTAAAAAQTKANAAETPAGAQSKANAAENNAIAYVDAKPWQKVKVTDDAGWAINIGAQDLNTPRKTGWYMGSGMANAPGAGWYYIEVIRHNDSWEVQNAYDFNGSGSFQQRKKQNGIWTAWTQDLFTSVANGKQAIASAISGKGVSASGSDEFTVLANRISQIKTGVKVVTASLNGLAGTIANLPFKPMMILLKTEGRAWSPSGGSAYFGEGYVGAYLHSSSQVVNLAPLRGGRYNDTTSSVYLTDVTFGENSVYVNLTYYTEAGTYIIDCTIFGT
ncbi:pyocin knob domain-containing protein [Paenibacillus lautus]|uniref:pyocin knob domain-containing protein n=1 Tax=Paenibacillus lautus TaxID=1401 RepID=UPI002FBE35A3